jgi:hypothetical protein
LIELIGMSISSATHRFLRLTARQRMLIVGSIAAGIAGALNARNGVAHVLVSACLWGVAAVLVERTLEAARGAEPDRRALIAYLPLGCAALAYLVAKTSADHATSGSLDSFFAAAASLLGLLLVSVVIEARRAAAAARDPWLRALRGWWVAFIIIGILYALAGLTPGQSPKAQARNYQTVWAGLAGAVVALTVVMWKEPAPERDATHAEQEIENPRE